jgi:Nucleotidyltransferase domain
LAWEELILIEIHLGLAVKLRFSYIAGMTGGPPSRSELLALLRRHEKELRAHGVETVSLFGSLARGDATDSSDVDLAIRPGPGFSSGDSTILAGWKLFASTWQSFSAAAWTSSKSRQCGHD